MALKVWAAENGEKTLESTMCSIHVSGRWFDNHKPKIKANLKLMTANFVALNNCTSHQMVVSKVAFDKMIQKWSTK